MKNLKGWSLLEVLIGVTIAAVAGGLIINLMVSSNSLFFDQSAQISHGLSLNQAKLEITDLIKSSAGIVTQYPESGAAQYTTDTNTLVVKLPAISSGGDVIESVYDYAVIEADTAKPTVLRKQIFKGAGSYRNPENKVLSASLANLSFSYLDINNVPVAVDQAVRVNFVINLSTKSGFSENKSSGSGTVNIKNL